MGACASLGWQRRELFTEPVDNAVEERLESDA